MRSSSVLVSLLLLPLSTFAVPLPPAGVVAGTAEAEAARLAEAQAAWAERTVCTYFLHLTQDLSSIE